jgi:hypothetical protein
MNTPNTTPARTTDPSLIDLWPYINQIEEVLDVMNAGFAEYFEDCIGTQERSRATINSLHNLLGAAQTVAAALARAAAVR